MSSIVSSTPGPLNPGNVVSAAVRLYRDRFTTYLALSARATLWLLVPIYGWAKYVMYMGVMARLAFQELINQPESPQQAYRQVNPKLWSFLGLMVWMLLIFIGVYVGMLIVGGIAGFVLGFVVVGVSTAFLGSEAGAVIGGALAGLVLIGLFLIGLVWFISRLLISDVPLAIEASPDARRSISRSWQLTKASVVRIQFVVLAAFLITLPILLLSNILPQLALVRVEVGTPAFGIVYAVSLILSLAANILTLPFWQTLKGVLYYDLCSRREGLDLKR